MAAAAELVKENAPPASALAPRWLALAAVASALAALCAALASRALPAPLSRADAPPDRFVAERARAHLLDLTALGPRVAGSYENEVLAVRVLVDAVQRIAREASPHNRVELDVHTASGAFPLSFFDGMTNVYRGVQSVVVRAAATGAPARGARAPPGALLLNCHFDTVPDSPGASDDGAGCAVLLETLRALVAAPAPLRRPAVFLLNGAEENIMQASHAFITGHRWARDVRAFVNLEACGAGGREVLFQAGPHAPWLVEAYAAAAPHPFASSLAQELFESGLVAADTDFRVFRDFGGLAGLDLAWSANGYVYHTALDTAELVPAAVLQRTGDNVLALARALLASEWLDAPRGAALQPAFSDVLGLRVVSARVPVAAALAIATLLLVALRVQLNARAAARQLYVRRAAWWRCVARALVAWGAALACGAVLCATLAALQHAAGARMAYYSRPWLLAPLYALPALCGAALAGLSAWGGGAVLLRGWWGARAWADALAAGWALLLLLCALRGLRSGFLPLLWALLPTLGELAAHAAGCQDGVRAWCWCAGAALPALQTWYLALDSLATLVPLAGRAGTPLVPADVTLALLVAALTLSACSWIMPLLVATKPPRRLLAHALLAALVASALAALSARGAPYSEARPQRFMLFHTRRTMHAHGSLGAEPAPAENLFWMPHLDANTPHSVDAHVPGVAGARATRVEDCTRWLLCGAPYYLPVLRLVGAGHWLDAETAPRARLHAALELRRLNGSAHSLHVELRGPSHVVLAVAPAPGARLASLAALPGAAPLAPYEGPRWGARRTYFVTLHDAAAGAQPWRLELVVEGAEGGAAGVAQLSLAGHALSGADKLTEEHARLARSFPPWAAVTGWGVDLHLYSV